VDLGREGDVLLDPRQTAWCESASLRQVDEVRHVAGDDRQLVLHGPDDRDGADQAARVRVGRSAEEGRHVALLDDLAGIHDGHPVAHLGDHAEVVGDEDDRRAGLVPEVAHEIEDLRLDRHVERGGGLVGDQQLRFASQRHRDHHALSHATRQLVRECLEATRRVGDTDHPQELEGALFGGSLFHPAMELQDLGDLRADVPDGVQ
jgi:hypothetical protein